MPHIQLGKGGDGEKTPSQISLQLQNDESPLLSPTSAKPDLVESAALKYIWRCKFAAISGIIIFVVALAMELAFNTIVDDIVWRETSVTSPSSTLYQAWVNPSSAGVNIYRSYTFYNLTNPQEVLDGVPPNFIERGPYVYSESRVKDESSIQWFPNGTVGYRYTSVYEFLPEMSQDAITGDMLSDADVFILANAPLIGLTHRLSRTPNDLGHFGWIPISKQDCCVLLDLMIQNATVGPQSIFVNRSVKEVLWGYEDPIWEAVHEALSYVNYTASKIFRAEWNGTYVVPSPYTFRSGQMCPLWDHNDACNSTTNLYTLEGSGAVRGVSDVQQGHIKQWAGQRRLWWWGDEIDGYTGGQAIMERPKRGIPDYSVEDTDPCHEVSGSDGFRFGPNVSPSSTLQMYLDMLWRNVPLSYWRDTTIKSIPAHSFSLSQPVLDNTTEENQKCYHMQTYGLLNFSRPLYGPGFATKARFLDAQLTPSEVNYTVQRYLLTGNSTAANRELSPRMPVLDYLNRYYGRESNPDAFRAAFESHLDVNGLTGITVNGVAQGEVLTIMKPVEVSGCPGLFQSSAKLIETYYPLATVKRATTVSDSYASKLSTALTLVFAARVTLLVLMPLGLLTTVVSVALLVRKRKMMQSFASTKKSAIEDS